MANPISDTIDGLISRIRFLIFFMLLGIGVMMLGAIGFGYNFFDTIFNFDFGGLDGWQFLIFIGIFVFIASIQALYGMLEMTQ